MKKKILLFSLAIALVFVLGGCGKKEPTPSVQPAKLSDWLKSGKGVVCTVNTPDGEIITKSKGEKIKMEGVIYSNMATGKMEKGTSLMDGDWIYTWSGSEGVKMNIKEISALAGDSTEEEIDEEYSWEEWAESMEAFGAEYSCREDSLSEDEFKVPDGVVFSDFGEFLRDIQSQVQKIETNPSSSDDLNLPAFSGSAEMNQEDIEAQFEDLLNQ